MNDSDKLSDHDSYKKLFEDEKIIWVIIYEFLIKYIECLRWSLKILMGKSDGRRTFSRSAYLKLSWKISCQLVQNFILPKKHVVFNENFVDCYCFNNLECLNILKELLNFVWEDLRLKIRGKLINFANILDSISKTIFFSDSIIKWWE